MQELRKGSDKENEGFYFNEIRNRVHEKHYNERHFGHFHWYFARQITNLFRTDALYGNSEMVKYSTEKLTDEYSTFSEKLKERYPGYTIDDHFAIVPLPETRTVNFKDFIELLKSKNLSKLKENRWIFEGGAKFLDGTVPVKNKICYSSHPRSGNSFMRKYFESVTGISTGSDISLDGFLILTL